MTSPFDDPEFREQMARMGVAHKPGMAADMMKQIAPLLAADGIDMDNLDTVNDLDTLNAALGRATEQHNFMLFSPTGTQREQALALLRDVTLALGEEKPDRAASILATIEPEPRDDSPSVAHVIGGALGLLDTWHSDPALRTHLSRTRVPRWHNGPSRKAGTDIIGLSKKGRAFDSISGLHRRHSGFSIFEGGALAVAGSILAWAASEGIEPEELLNRVVSDTSYRSPSGSSFRRPTAPPTRGNEREFRAWLERAAPEIAAPTVEAEARMFASLLRIADELSLDLSDADDALIVFDELLEQGEDSPIEPALLTLYDYAQFQIEIADDPDGWEALCDEIDAELEGPSPILEAVRIALEADSEIPDAEVRSILQKSVIATAVGPMLAWVGKGRTVTATGNVRRSDIESVAALLGISAIGVAKHFPWGDGELDRILSGEGRTHFPVMSMSEVPMLSDWWEALRVCDILAVTGTRVKPGPAAVAWADGAPTLDDLRMLISVFISGVITRSRASDLYALARAAELMQHLSRAVAPGVLTDDVPESGSFRDAMRTSARHTVARLSRLGIGEVDADDVFSMPTAVRGTVASGIGIAMALFREGVE